MIMQRTFIRNTGERIDIVTNEDEGAVSIRLQNESRVGEWSLPFQSYAELEAFELSLAPVIKHYRFTMVDSEQVG